MTSHAILELIRLNGTDTNRINHALKVHGLALCIAGCENVSDKEKQIIELAAVLHDIAIRHCESTFGSCAGRLQEQEGPGIARPILERCTNDDTLIERVLYIIAHHHTYGTIEGIDYQIIIEADFLVNRDEADISPDAFVAAYRKYFQTATGKELAYIMFGVQ